MDKKQRKVLNAFLLEVILITRAGRRHKLTLDQISELMDMIHNIPDFLYSEPYEWDFDKILVSEIKQFDKKHNLKFHGSTLYRRYLRIKQKT